MTDPEVEHIVVASIHLPPDLALTGKSALHARVENIAVADRAPDVVAASDVPLVEAEVDAGDLRVQIDIPSDRIDQSGTYTLFVHVDVDGSGEVSRGDALTTRTHPVLTAMTAPGAPDSGSGVEVIDIDLTRIG